MRLLIISIKIIITFDDADAVHDGRVVSLVTEVSSTYRLDAESRLAEVDFTSSVVEVERRELVASQGAADTDRQTAEETQLIGHVDWRPLSVDRSHGAELMTDRVDVDRTVQQTTILCTPQQPCSSDVSLKNWTRPVLAGVSFKKGGGLKGATDTPGIFNFNFFSVNRIFKTMLLLQEQYVTQIETTQGPQWLLRPPMIYWNNATKSSRRLENKEQWPWWQIPWPWS